MAVATAITPGTGMPPACDDEPATAPAPADYAQTLTAAALPEVGACWIDRYQVGEALGEIAGARAWRARLIETGEEVILRSVMAPPGDQRAAAWRALVAIAHPNLLRALPAVTVGARRVEIHPVPVGCPLNAWHPGRADDPATVEALLTALAGALGALHAQGVAHFSVNPRNIFVREDGGQPHFVLGGFETVAVVAQSGLITIPVDPFYAPPEAAGLFQHSPGEGLLAWDWWSVGRIVQERLLGHHVLGHLLQRDVSRATPELNARAEALLLERDAGAPCAGAVERMPGLDGRLTKLLHGLLTGARDGRWGGAEVAGWLAGEEFYDYYHLSREERLFRWQGRGWLIVEAAEKLRSADHWREAIGHVWNRDQAGTLAHFLATVPAHRKLFASHEEVLKMATATALKNLPVETIREMISALALLELAGSQLVWRGERLMGEGLAKIFGDESTGEGGLVLMQAFLARPIVLFIEHADLAAARALGELGDTANSAEWVLRRHRWLHDRDAEGRTRLLRCALEPLPRLHAIAVELHERFACSTDPAMDRIFQLPKPAHADLVVLAWAAECAEARGFLTHVQWGERELARLRASGAENAAALAWLRLAEVLGCGPLLFGQWWALAPVWLLLGAPIAFIWPGPWGFAAMFAPVALAAAIRLAASWSLRVQLRRAVAGVEPWDWRDGRRRCRLELHALGAASRGRTAAETAFHGVNAEIVRLTMLQPPPAPVAPPPHFHGVRIVAIASAVLAVSLLVGAGWQVKVQKPSWPKFVTAWRAALPKKVEPTPAEKAAAEEEADRNMKVSWPYRSEDYAKIWRPSGMVEARSDQVRYATKAGRELVKPYKLQTIDTPIFLRVPTEQKYGLMLYNGRERQLVSTRVYLLDFQPLPRGWIQVDGKQGIYLPQD